MRRALAGLMVAAAAAGLRPPEALAQDATPPRFARMEIAGGISWAGVAAFDARPATLTTSTGGPYRFFSTSSELTSAVGAEASIGIRVKRRVLVEGVVSFSAPELQTTIANDVEGASAVTATESIRQFTAGGAVVFDVRRVPRGSRPVLFVRGGAAYLRQLHETQTLVQEGQAYDAGGGIRLPLGSRSKPGGGVRQFGIRAEGRATIRTGGIALDGKTHVSPVLTAALFVQL